MTAPAGAAYTPTEMMVVAGARAMAGARVCFVGIGLPNIAVALAQRTVAPAIELIYESGVYGARPARLPLSIGDPCLVTGAIAAMSMPELFQYYLQRGHVDLGFLGAAQLDRYGNVNTTVIGDYAAPRTRLPGSGGACEIAQNAREVFVLMRQSARSFVEKVDFVTSSGRRLSRVITDLGVFDNRGGELTLTAVHPGGTVARVQEATGWPLSVAADLAESPPPTPAELRLLREELDPDRAYLK
ncbi:3-oxoadipate--succinyl-CoA transferase subunit B [Pilimelia anulata]|uniref:3-oxoadipate--succinyl-CoA transferase subunit B n=2 Tax=Pilimelia anulata TaxID=53371 RepID=A0A8J3B775_9ACTN|nr:CoA-transferase [Pilimelia anulata]GGJ79221.1 3-oxoadipate--succinyl-CoA transferase subunit B [Pilimelia anulata]